MARWRVKPSNVDEILISNYSYVYKAPYHLVTLDEMKVIIHQKVVGIVRRESYGEVYHD